MECERSCDDRVPVDHRLHRLDLVHQLATGSIVSKVWFTSDLHIGHIKVAEERFPARKLTPEHHEAILADNWDSLISDDDVVWVLGDISCGKTPDQWAALDWVDRRPGRKRLILGNHDGPHPKHRDAHKWLRPYSEVFEHVSTSARIRIPRSNGHLTALLSHFPYTGDHSVQDRDTQWRLRDHGELLIHGHTHSEDRISVSEYLTPQIHVGVDAWNMAPVSLDEISQCVTAGELSGG